MILEIEDIIENQKGMGHVPMPKGLTLGRVFDHDDKLKNLKSAILQVSINGIKNDRWEELCPGKNDRVKMTLGPNAFLAPLVPIFTAITAIISVVSFFISLFNQPKSPKLQGSIPSASFGFEGIRDSFAPGEPVPVVYGIHRKGGQVLMHYLEIASGSGGKTLIMNEQLAMAEGTVSSIGAVEINGIPVTDISSSVTIQTRLGQTSQSVMNGFDRIRNSFADAREITSATIIYRTVGNDIESVDLIILAPVLTAPNRRGDIRTQLVPYSIERRQLGLSTWVLVQSGEQIVGGSLDPTYFLRSIPLPARSTYDIRLKKLGFVPTRPAGQHNIFLHAVTEYRDVAGSYSGTALLGIRAIATAQVHGGRPTVTALVHGRDVRRYTSLNSFTIGHTQNPAWGVLDYMTNSIYGMGPFISNADIDLQSFLDFATLADSNCQDCESPC